jgi:UDP-N-acetylglucosamine 2-epimerase (non-hydrolysing)
MKAIHLLVGTRPNFIKITQFKKLAPAQLDIKIIHTGQHFNANMADVFFRELEIMPDYFLDIKPDTPVMQMAEIMTGLSKLYQQIPLPDALVVPGDVNSTLAGAIFANKTGIKLIHLEAGLRSFDRTMPEEHNRVLTDHLSDILFVTEPSGLLNIEKEHLKGEYHHVGNTMIDTLVGFESQIELSNIIQQLGIKRKFILTTIHRPATVDNKGELEKLLQLFNRLSSDYDIIFPVHPRTLKNLDAFGLMEDFRKIKGLLFIEPLGYFDFQKLVKDCALVLTDSGGIQEETTYRQKPCLTLRPNTERPVTIDEGSNMLVPFDINAIMNMITSIENGTYKKGGIPQWWDGNATKRIIEILMQKL